MKKKIIIVLVFILVIILFIVGLYFYSLTSVSNSSEMVNFSIKSGTSTKEVINNLYDAKLIKSKIATLIYVKLHKNILIQAGDYELNKSYSTKEILDLITKGRISKDTINITFIEGKRIVDYMKLIEENFGYSKESIENVLKDQDFLNELINDYDFIDDSILNKDLYYSLEGYLFPAKYEFYKDASIKDIIKKMLDKTQNVLDNYSTSIKESGYSNHEILTIASIIENESMFKEDRSLVSQVIYKRLKMNMSLGMDVTTFYAARKPLDKSEGDITQSEINDYNAYNTRNTSFKGLPVGPISNPSEAAIKAALNPSDTNYVYFYAEKTGKLHFAETYEEFQNLITKYRW